MWVPFSLIDSGWLFLPGKCCDAHAPLLQWSYNHDHPRFVLQWREQIVCSTVWIVLHRVWGARWDYKSRGANPYGGFGSDSSKYLYLIASWHHDKHHNSSTLPFMSGVPGFINRQPLPLRQTLTLIEVISIRSKISRMGGRALSTEWCATYTRWQGEFVILIINSLYDSSITVPVPLEM
jgi:hypothetical protein